MTLYNRSWKLLNEEECGEVEEELESKLESFSRLGKEGSSEKDLITKKVTGIDSDTNEERTLYKVTDGENEVYVDPNVLEPIM